MPLSPIAAPEYHSLSPLRSDGSFPSKSAFPIVPPKRPQSVLVPARQWPLLARIGLFIITEGAFIVLSAYAMKKPIPLSMSSTFSITEAKGGITIISIIWHALAVFAVKDIVVHIFSAEWMEQIRRSGTIVLEETDIVSRVSAGYLDKLQHFISQKATPPYRLGLIAAILLVVLNGLGPSALTVNSISLPQSTTIPVANLTITEGALSFNPSSPLAWDRANLITRLELLEKSTYEFRTQQSNVLIPWPSVDLIDTNDTIRYETDVITYNFSCSWHTPISLPDQGNWIWNVSNEGYAIHPGGDAELGKDLDICDPMIFPLLGTGALEDTSNNPLSGFFFAGSNTTLDGRFLNLDDLPTTFIGPPDPSAPSNATQPKCFPMVVSAMICDPQFQIRHATVRMFAGSLTSNIHPGPPVVKNVPEKAANALFAQSLAGAVSATPAFSQNSGKNVNEIARALFLADPSFFEHAAKPGAKLLPLDKINANMNRALLSSGKAYMSGYRANDSDTTFPSFVRMDTTAVREVEKLALVGSEPFLIALTVLVGLLVLFFVTIAIVVRVDQLRTFDLKHIVEALGLQSDL